MAVSTYSQAAVDALSAAMQADPSVIAMGKTSAGAESSANIVDCRPNLAPRA